MLEIYACQKYIKWMSENCSCISRNACVLYVRNILMYVKNICMCFQKHKTTKSGLQIFLETSRLEISRENILTR